MRRTGCLRGKIGEDDNINAQLLSGSSNYVLVLADPSGQTGTGNGFVNGELQSHEFAIDGKIHRPQAPRPHPHQQHRLGHSLLLLKLFISGLDLFLFPTSASTTTNAASKPSSSARSIRSKFVKSKGAFLRIRC